MMTKRADLLIMHANEIHSLITNCEEKIAVAELPRDAKAELEHARTSLFGALQAITEELGMELLKR